MHYLFIVMLAIVIPLLMGRVASARIDAAFTLNRRISAALILGATVLWLALGLGLRYYADGDGPGWRWAEWFAHRGKWYTFIVGSLFVLGASVTPPRIRGVRLALARALAVLLIGVFLWRTMPCYFGLPETSRRDARGHLRQSIEQTCAPVSLGNLLEVVYHIVPPSERELARLTRTTQEGTPLATLIAAASALGLPLFKCQVMDLKELQALDTPALVQISTLPQVRHATLLLRVGEKDIEFIDPAYGYRRISHARFKEIWYGKTLIFKQSPAWVQL